MDVESDNLLVINKLKTKAMDGSYLGVVLREIINLVSAFDCVAFKHVFREANVAAHIMAHINPFDYSTRVWVGCGPEAIEDVIAADFCLASNEA